MIGFSGAKINIGLRIGERRKDGYHEIFSLFYPLPFYDAIEIHEAKQFGYTQKGRAIPCDLSDNLCYKAWHLLHRKYPIPPVQVYHQKNIPMGAGLGGGSANATCMIQLLDRYFQLSLSAAEQYDLAKTLSADSAFFIENKAAWVSGKGDEISLADIALTDFQIALCVPKHIHISSHWAYLHAIPRPIGKTEKERIQTQIHTLPPKEWTNIVVNDFEPVLTAFYPQLNAIKKGLYAAGAHFAAMTGSGSAFFGIFEKRQLPLQHPFPHCDIYYP